ncbi:MAG: polysaccharide deacetylase family protein [Nitrososphaeraceae archaeon]
MISSIILLYVFLVTLLAITPAISLDHNTITADAAAAAAAAAAKHHHLSKDKISKSLSSLSSSQFSPHNTKAVIINFDDGSIGQYTYAKPILDKYGFKATFFIVCNYANYNYGGGYMNWQQVTQLQNDGMDIESHSMNHKDLGTLPVADLDYEIGQSKQCLLDHGINGDGTGIDMFAYPGHSGADNPTIVNTVAKYYDTARSGDIPLQFLNVHTNRYALAGINVVLETQIDKQTKSYINDFQTSLDRFINLVNSQDKYNNNENGQINAIPVIAYHKIDPTINNNTSASITPPDLFDAEMKYLHDNGFKVYTMANLRYNQNNDSVYLGDIPGITAGASSD